MSDVASFTLLYSEFFPALYHFTLLLLHMSGNTEKQEVRYAGSAPVDVFWGEKMQDYWGRGGHFNHRNFQIGPSNLRFFSSQQVSYSIALETD